MPSAAHLLSGWLHRIEDQIGSDSDTAIDRRGGEEIGFRAVFRWFSHDWGFHPCRVTAVGEVTLSWALDDPS